MARQRHLARAPIAEAVIDIRVHPRDGLAPDVFDPVQRRLAAEYPVGIPLNQARAQITLEGGSLHPVASQVHLGVMLKSPDEKNLAQFRVDGFTFNRLAPYTKWELLFPEALRLWREYAAVAQPTAVVRLATRYINRLAFRLPVPDLAEYLTAPPHVPEGVPQQVRAFLTRLVIHDPSHDQSAIVTQAVEPSIDPEGVVVLLDIDAYRDVEMAPTDERIEVVLASLRQLKNDIFFGSITEAAAELFA